MSEALEFAWIRVLASRQPPAAGELQDETRRQLALAIVDSARNGTRDREGLSRNALRCMFPLGSDGLTPRPDVPDQGTAVTAHVDQKRAGHGPPKDHRGRTELTGISRDIVEHLRRTHGRPGVRHNTSDLFDRFGTDPAVATAISELVELGFIEHPDMHTVRLTARGFEAAHRQEGS